MRSNKYFRRISLDPESGISFTVRKSPYKGKIHQSSQLRVKCPMIDVKKKTRFPRHSQYKEYIKCFSVDKLGIDEAWKQAKKCDMLKMPTFGYGIAFFLETEQRRRAKI